MWRHFPLKNVSLSETNNLCWHEDWLPLTCASDRYSPIKSLSLPCLTYWLWSSYAWHLNSLVDRAFTTLVECCHLWISCSWTHIARGMVQHDNSPINSTSAPYLWTHLQFTMLTPYLLLSSFELHTLSSPFGIRDLVLHIRHFFVFFQILLSSLSVFWWWSVTHLQFAPKYVGFFWWCGVIVFVDSWWVRSCIHPALGWPDGCSVAMVVMTIGSNRAVGVCMGYGCVKSCPSTISFCLVASYGSLVMSRNIAWVRRFSRLIRWMVL